MPASTSARRWAASPSRAPRRRSVPGASAFFQPDRGLLKMNAVDLLPSDLFAGRTAFITGGGSGINFAIARHFASLGAHVAICSRDIAKLEAAAALLRDCG